jgi:hypothetical protein
MSGCMTSSIPPPPTGSWTPSLGTLDLSNAGDPTPQHARTDAPQESDISSLSYLLTMSTTSSHTKWIQFRSLGQLWTTWRTCLKFPVLAWLPQARHRCCPRSWESQTQACSPIWIHFSYECLIKNIKYVNYFSVTLNRHKTNLNSKLEIFSELKIRK